MDATERARRQPAQTPAPIAQIAQPTAAAPPTEPAAVAGFGQA